MMHLLWRFARPPKQARKRREIVDVYAPEAANPQGGTIPPILVETDGGTFWVGTPATLFLVGGVTGDVYEVTITENVPRDLVAEAHPEESTERIVDVYEEPFRFALTTYVVAGGGFVSFPPATAYHQFFELGSGSAQLFLPLGGTIPITTPGYAGRVPLSGPPIQVSTGYYRTTGEL
jgi:hypothetical protein